MSKYNAKILRQTSVYIDNNTGDVCNPSETERLIDGCKLNGENKFTFCILYSCIADISGKTYRELNDKAYKIAEEKNIYDFEIYIKK